MSLTAILAICAIEPFGLKAVTFEVVSAIATVGLSLGLTPQLSAASRVILILLMYAGRIGGLSFVLLFSERRSEPPLDRPTGKILARIIGDINSLKDVLGNCVTTLIPIFSQSAPSS